MPHEITFCFDECLPKGWCNRLGSVLKDWQPGINCVHLIDRYRPGAKDDEVADWLASQTPRVMMISQDSGRKSRGCDPRLQLLLPERKITGVFVNPKLTHRPAREKFRMMLVCLPDLLGAYHGPAGYRYRVCGSRENSHSYRLEAWPLKPHERC